MKSPDTTPPAKSPARWIVSQEGSRQSYAVPVSFHRLNLLRLFYVDTWCRWGRSWLRRGPRACRTLASHFTPALPGNLVVSFNSTVLHSRARFYWSKSEYSPAQLSSEYCRFGQNFARLVWERLRRQDLDATRDCFFGFNTNCLETLEHLRARGVFTVVDQVDPGKFEEDLCQQEAERWPGWARHRGRMSRGYWDRLRSEWQMANLVLVNSEWSAQALVQQGVPRQKIIVVPLAIEIPHNPTARMRVRREATLRVLWLGSIILRKGIQYLVQAARRLQGRPIEFLLAGPMGVSAEATRSFPDNMKLLGPMSRDRLGRVYETADLFVLPTLSDGFGITQLEAMAHGLPVVTTRNCGRVVTDGVDGLLVPARDAEALADALGRLEADRELLEQMSENALRTAVRFDLPSNAALIQQLVRDRRIANGQSNS